MCDPNHTPMPGSHLPLEDPYQSEHRSKGEGIVPLYSEYTDSYFGLATRHVHTDDKSTTSPTDPWTVRKSDNSGSCQAPRDIENSNSNNNDFHCIAGKLQPITPENTPLPDLDGESFVLSDEMHRSLQRSTDCATTYLALGMPASIDDGEVECALKRRRSTWGRHTGLYDGTGYDFGDDRDSITQETFSPPAHVADDLVESAREIMSLESEASGTGAKTMESETVMSSKPSVSISSAPQGPPMEDVPLQDDEKETLQDIISSYARSPMFFDGEFSEERKRGLRGSLTEEDAEAYSEGSQDSVKGEVVLSIKLDG
jgi:hypothetical protein